MADRPKKSPIKFLFHEVYVICTKYEMILTHPITFNLFWLEVCSGGTVQIAYSRKSMQFCLIVVSLRLIIQMQQENLGLEYIKCYSLSSFGQCLHHFSSLMLPQLKIHSNEPMQKNLQKSVLQTLNFLCNRERIRSVIFLIILRSWR